VDKMTVGGRNAIGRCLVTEAVSGEGQSFAEVSELPSRGSVYMRLFLCTHHLNIKRNFTFHLRSVYRWLSFINVVVLWTSFGSDFCLEGY